MCLVSMPGGKRYGAAGVEAKVIFGRLVTSTRISRRIVWMWLNHNHLIESVDASSASLLNILPGSVPKIRTRDLVQSTESSRRPLQDVVDTVEVRRGVVWGGLEVEQIKRRVQLKASIG